MHCNIASCNAMLLLEKSLIQLLCYSAFCLFLNPVLRNYLVTKTMPIHDINSKYHMKKQESCSSCLIGWFSFISHGWGQTHTDIVDKSNFNRPDMCLVYKSLNTFYWLCMKTKIFNAYCFGLKTSNDEISLTVMDWEFFKTLTNLIMNYSANLYFTILILSIANSSSQCYHALMWQR